MKKVIFPFDESFESVLYFVEEQWKNDEIILLKPESWAPFGKSEISCNGRIYRICTELSMDEPTDVLFVNSIINMDIEDVLDAIKNVNINCFYTYRMLSMNEKLCLKDSFPNISFCEFIIDSNDCEEVLYEIHTPVVVVGGGVSEYTNKFATQLEIVSNFKKYGYSVGFMGSRGEAFLCGGITLPNMLYSKMNSIKEKVICLNHCLKEYETKNKFDVIVLGVPGEVVVLDKNYIGHACEIAFVVSQAVGISDLVICMMYDDNLVIQKNIYGEKISKRLGKSIDHYVITNRMLDPDETELRQRVKYTSISKTKVVDKIHSIYLEDTYLLFDKQGTKKLVEDIINKLSR